MKYTITLSFYAADTGQADRFVNAISDEATVKNIVLYNVRCTGFTGAGRSAFLAAPSCLQRPFL